ncbi:hypothetical protein AAFP35_23505 [Gordonia sp. CPCC 206044]|uniref:hypothetical protein n=1 Tax=Gordonia sp. CPCC 206044 TaxID=3140793 RepID=UPI003AF34EEB
MGYARRTRATGRIGMRAGVASSTRVAAVLSALVIGLSGCAMTVDGQGGPVPGDVDAYRSDLMVSRAADARVAGAELCREAMSSMVVMVRGYNAFIRRLNDVDSYDRVGDLDEKARASLIAGADLIRKKLTSTVSGDTAEPTNQFLDSTGRLSAAIGKQQLAGLNAIAAEWTRDKQAVLNRCAPYLPLPPTAGASAVQPSTSSGPVPATP